MPVSLCAPHASRLLWKPEEDWLPGTGVRGGLEPQMWPTAEPQSSGCTASAVYHWAVPSWIHFQKHSSLLFHDHCPAVIGAWFPAGVGLITPYNRSSGSLTQLPFPQVFLSLCFLAGELRLEPHQQKTNVRAEGHCQRQNCCGWRIQRRNFIPRDFGVLVSSFALFGHLAVYFWEIKILCLYILFIQL